MIRSRYELVMPVLKPESEIVAGWRGAKDQVVVSVCCVAFNHGPYIRRALTGILSQITDFPFEVIVNDDCSTDETSNVIREFQSAYPGIVKPIFHRENQFSQGRGPFAAFVFPRAKGAFLALLECDDFWLCPEKLQKQVDIFRNNPGTSLVHTDVGHMVSVSGKELIRPNVNKSRKVIGASGDMAEAAWFRCSIFTCSVMYRRDVIVEYCRSGFTDTFCLSGDRAMALFAAQRGKFAYLNEMTSVYRENIASLTNSDNRNFVRFAFEIQYLFDFFLDYFSKDSDFRERCQNYSQARRLNAVIKYGTEADLGLLEDAAINARPLAWLRLRRKIGVDFLLLLIMRLRLRISYLLLYRTCLYKEAQF